MSDTDFHSVLFEDPRDRDGVDECTMPDFFGDLNLDQVVAAAARGREDYRLTAFFFVPLSRVEDVAYRHEVVRDLQQQEEVLSAVTEFAKRMRSMRDELRQTTKLRYARQQQLWFLDAVRSYSAAVSLLSQDLAGAAIKSRALRGLRGYLAAYTDSDGFQARTAEADRLHRDLGQIRYTLDIRADRVRVARYDSEPDYTAEVEETFERFHQGAVRDYRIGFPDYADMNHVEATVLEFVAKLHPETFAGLEAFRRHHAGYADTVITDFDREVQFYVAWLEYVADLTASGLHFCLPEITADSKEVHVDESFDVALATKLVPESRPVVCNDVELQDAERILVISGPNQGGKTTFARMFGQLHYLGLLGCPVPGRRARLFLCDQIFTHFEREEQVTDLHGKLEDDLLRMHGILEQATGNSIVIMNEIFTSTTLHDAVFLGQHLMRRLIELDLLGVCVTFVDELSRIGPSTVSMVSTVDPEDPASRTFKVVRQPADGLSHAVTIAQKYGLTYERLKERIQS
jgi:DNA mismatch repair protein MutS